MEHQKNNSKADPDYEIFNSALELNEEEEKTSKLSKIRQIIEDEYNKEIAQRQEHIEQIELAICKIRQLLHLLRYVSVTSYYNKKELEFNGMEDEQSNAACVAIPEDQNRIHPAVKKLIGKNPTNLDYLKTQKRRGAQTRNKTVPSSPANRTLNKSLQEPESKRIKLESEQLCISEPTSSVSRSSSASLEYEEVDTPRNRKKIKRRIIVGNISKWIESLEDDNLTHKWMLYVRGPKERPDVSDFVQKVTIYLHPSYKPHDVVEVGKAPFHLSRRGWGEFPVRVQIHFINSLNKPVDVVHNITLDKKYTGRQTLGTETVVDLLLYNTAGDDSAKTPRSFQSSSSIDVSPEETIVDSNMLVEDIKIDVDEYVNNSHDAPPSSILEHNYYCFEDSDEMLDLTDHTYSMSSSYEHLPKPKQEKIDVSDNPPDNILIYGLDYSYFDPNVDVKLENNQQLNDLLSMNALLTRNDIKCNNTKILMFGKTLEEILLHLPDLTLQHAPINLMSAITKYGLDFKITLPKNKFKNMGEALPYMFKKLPLVSDLATNPCYKQMYPFTSCSIQEFKSLSKGIQRSAEWIRAKVIQKILVREKIYDSDNWNTKSLIMYGRSHGYSPNTPSKLFVRDSEEKRLISSCYVKSDPTAKKIDLRNVKDDDTSFIDVDSDAVNSPKKQKLSERVDQDFPLECRFVRQTALDCGFVLKAEEVEGVATNAAERVILEAVKCFADNLIRRALNHRMCNNNFSSSTSISAEDVTVALNERPEMQSLLKFRNDRRDLNFFS